MIDIAAKAAEANRFLTRIDKTTSPHRISYDAEVVRMVVGAGGDFEWVPGRLTLEHIRRLGRMASLEFLREPEFEALTTHGKWAIRMARVGGLSKRPVENTEGLPDSVFARGLLCRRPFDTHERRRLLEVAYLIFLDYFRGEQPGNNMTLFALRDTSPLDPQSMLPPWVMAFHDPEGLDVRIFPSVSVPG